jgi:20S proteasome alpha/beta subunit
MTLAEAEALALDTLKQVMEDKIEKSNIEIAVVRIDSIPYIGDGNTTHNKNHNSDAIYLHFVCQ